MKGGIKIEYRYFTSRITLNDTVKKYVDNQIWLQNHMYNSLVIHWNDIIREDLKEKKNRGYFKEKELYQFLKEGYPDEVESQWCGSRLLRGAITNYITGWKRVFDKKYLHNPPTYHEYNYMEMVVSFYDIDTDIHKKFHLHMGARNRKDATTCCTIEDNKILEFIDKNNGKLFSYAIRRRRKHYFIILGVKFPDGTFAIQSSKQGEIGLDWGLKNFFTDDKGKTYNLPKAVWTLEKRIRKMRYILNQKEFRSKNYFKILNKLNKLCQKQTNIKKDWIEKFTLFLLRNYSVIYIEKLNMEQLIPIMSRKNRFTATINTFGFFRDRLKEKSTVFNCKVVEVDQQKHPTTQLCSNCGYQQKMQLSERTKQCPKCGLVIDRDQNAAKNLIIYGRLTNS